MSNQSIDELELPASIQTIMTSWSLQTGYPIVTVRRNYDQQTAIVTQVTCVFHFFLTGFLEYPINRLIVPFETLVGTFLLTVIS